MVEGQIERIGVSLPSNLLSKFDGILEKRGYSSRSEGIRDAIRDYITDYEWISELHGERIGVITLMYDHNQKGVSDALMDLEHEFVGMVVSTLHVHLDEDNCLEVILIKADAEHVRDIRERITALKGVKHVKLTTARPEEKMGRSDHNHKR
ncbi:MAG: nickel-responsive transcriptional regulator NikR [Halobacteriota archaeon]|nr:nickel-responsive transcriptional regulator NikR [Halobacteriota archaeon]